ncbi:unnamed protein product [Parascedosporium putredinis]|uniref:Uncharacterized protein n=1 Tax=Parascedosporium putredinis TaxID=1442378 RepID=A0A9P1M6D7_9PEZI|nr:unnamed protein product [Parascedosporium putredinis]CAI7988285.1 unnamed protein product [Parascedosporium putredinis]
MTYYCSNYYGSIQCRTTVARFGDRCKLCTVMRVGASISDGLLPETPNGGLHNSASRDQSIDRRGEERRMVK